jgi:hypothetical protein
MGSDWPRFRKVQDGPTTGALKGERGAALPQFAKDDQRGCGTMRI